MSKKAKKARQQRPRKTSTALARRPQPAMRVRVNDPNNLLMIPETPAVALGVLTDDPSVANLGLVQVKLTKQEELVLSEPVIESQVLIKPTGQPYLPHRHYTNWFNKAFGRLGWMIVPRSKPTKTELAKEESSKVRHLVLVPYLMHVHGKPVAFAWGEQEYSEANAEQTYGDAVEATVANALRRVAKRMGVGNELWDQDWLRAWRAKHAIAVKVKYPNFNKPIQRWRRIIDPPLPFEVKPAKAGDAPPPDDEAEFHEVPPGDESRRKPRPAAGNDGTGDEIITKPQRQRLVTIANKAGRNDAEVRLWLKTKWKYNNSGEIKRKDYDAIVRELEARGPLSMPGDGEGR